MSLEYKISIIVPAYNVGLWLRKCLDSIICQTYRKLEIILIDDGSTDNTAEIIDEYAEKDNRIVAVHQENVGLVETREVGIRLASGDYVGFVDADDTISLDMYERLLSNAVKYQADISHCGVNFCFSDGTVEPHYNTGNIIIQDNFQGLKDLLESTFIEPGLWNKLYRRELLYNSCLEKTVLNNEDLLRNYVLFQRAKRSVYEDFCGYQYYQRSNSMSNNKANIVSNAKHIIRARYIIFENGKGDIKPYATKSLLSATVNIINSLLYIETEEAEQFYADCRNILKQEKNNLHLLKLKEYIAAKLLLFFPQLYKFMYAILYKR